MTLAAFLKLQKEQYESVLVEEIHLQVDPVEHRLIVISNLKEEHHEINSDVLKILNQIWEAQYLQWQDVQMRISRESQRVHRIEAQQEQQQIRKRIRKPHRPYAASRNRIVRQLL